MAPKRAIEVSLELSSLYKRRREIDEEIEKLELVEAKKYYEMMENKADNMMHGPANAAVCKEFDFYYNSFLNSSDATLESMKYDMQQHLLAYEIFDKLPYEKWDKYYESIYEQCGLILDSSIDQDEFDENRRDMIDEANE